MTSTRTRPRVTDHDRPARKSEDDTDLVDVPEDGAGLLGRPRRTQRRTGDGDVDVDVDMFSFAGTGDLVDLDDGELIMPVQPIRPDEFTCTRCFLVFHRSRLAVGGDQLVCNDCA